MRILADESIDRQIVNLLRENGFDVMYIAEVDPSISDDEVFDLAALNADLLITADKDFGEIVFRDRRVGDAAILLIRLAGLPPSQKAQLVLAEITANALQLLGNFTVLTTGGSRTRAKGFV